MDTTDADLIGILCDDDQPVFTAIARCLRGAGHEVQFFDPRSELSPGHIDDVALLVNKQVFPHNLPALRFARRTGTPLWNNLIATVALSSRLIGLRALEAVGFRTPQMTFEKPKFEYVAKPYYIWDGDVELNGEGGFYQELIATDPVDYKYYAVDNGTRVQTAVKRVTSKLYGPKRFLNQVRPRPMLARRLRRLVNRLDIRGVGVDFVKDDEDQFWAVDVNLAAGYRNSGVEPALCQSIRASLPTDNL
ncbi:hypothetical protein [Natrononativus amylolyticus]|uniref:hypothetical protein n=1 Tax=Natrononativus amylolyticus TaxID=2963434 RepID=UPI0020CFDBF5|nr:hypothetical protein [Natrononativus amylolyticus]